MTFVDLFCGIGGFHYALQSQGAKCVWACDWDLNARKTYRANHHIEPWGDITQAEFVSREFSGILKNNQIPPHDILCAGFPCQPFSLAGVSKKISLGRKHGFEDPSQGNLFFKLAEVIEHYKPKAFILENVKNLRSHDGGNTFIQIYNTLSQLGYHLHTQIVDAQHFVPQHRERIFIVGFRNPLPFEFPTIRATRGKDHGQRPTLSDILEKNPDPKYTLSDKLWTYLKNYAKKHKAAGNGFGFELCGPSDTSRTLSARYYKDGSEILINQHGRNPRRLTPNECRKLMGYPDSFIIPVSDAPAYKLFGNSVVVPVVTSIAESVVKTLNLFDYIDGRIISKKKKLKPSKKPSA
jgi:DNA (cytosine-5)-methyltransferase 1